MALLRECLQAVRAAHGDGMPPPLVPGRRSGRRDITQSPTTPVATTIQTAQLVRGGHSDVVSEPGASDFLAPAAASAGTP